MNTIQKTLKITLASVLLSTVANSSFAEENLEAILQESLKQAEVNDSKTTSYTPSQSNTFNNSGYYNPQYGGDNVVVKVPLTSKTKHTYKQVPFSTYDFINRIAKSKDYKTVWLFETSNGIMTTTTIYEDFYKDPAIDWKHKIAKSLEEFNSNTYRSLHNGTAAQAYACDNKYIVISEAKNVSRLYNTLRTSNCDLIIPREETQYFMNGKEYDVEKQEFKEVKQNKDEKEIQKEILPKDLKDKIDSPMKEKEQQKESLSTSTFSENL